MFVHFHNSSSLPPGSHFRTVHLDRLGSLSEETVRFYMAELSSALCFLHEKHIMHRFATLSSLILFFANVLCLSRHSNRDIKPDNILLDERGHAHPTDFNIAVHYSERRLLTGVAGSMAYMAPEILHKRGYTYPIDWWSLGVCAYELIFGRRPFRGCTNTALTLSISKDALRFPENAEEKCSSTGIGFIRGVRSTFRLAPCLAQAFPTQLLERDPSSVLHVAHGEIAWMRFNNTRGSVQSTGRHLTGKSFHLRSFPMWVYFLRDFSHDILFTTSFCIQSKKANFDASRELEELLLEDNPLKAKARKQNRDINSLSNKMRQMEEQCVESRVDCILEPCSNRILIQIHNLRLPCNAPPLILPA